MCCDRHLEIPGVSNNTTGTLGKSTVFFCILGSTVVIETSISAARELGNPIRNDFSFGS